MVLVLRVRVWEERNAQGKPINIKVRCGISGKSSVPSRKFLGKFFDSSAINLICLESYSIVLFPDTVSKDLMSLL